MITLLPLHKLIREYDFVPQAIILEPVFEVAKRFGSDVEEGEDDLDQYLGAAALLDEHWPFAVMHYRGHPKDTTTLYLPFKVRNIDDVTKIISMIVDALKIPETSIRWQRKDNPEL